MEKEAMANAVARSPSTKAPQQWMQVWAIVLNGGIMLPPIDDDSCECFMAFPTEADAATALESQTQKGYIDPGSAKVQRVA